MRAGIPFHRPMSRAEVARELGISRERTRELERSALGYLRAAARADRCAPGGAGAFTGAPGAMNGTLETIAVSGTMSVSGATATRAVPLADADDPAGLSRAGDGSYGIDLVSGVFEWRSRMAAVGGSLMLENPGASAAAIGFGLLLLVGGAAHVHRRRAF